MLQCLTQVGCGSVSRDYGVGSCLSEVWYLPICGIAGPHLPALPAHQTPHVPGRLPPSQGAGAAARPSEVGVASSADPRAGGGGVTPQETLTINAGLVAGALDGDPCQFLY
ncbi:hypothetical protein E2C01_051274 [Portunus trituberculatus]|uniref:Uncharacterized protein n=1 Tax=Portunus trituberculatus TaxID=210409 RepID=A0A5B7GJV2_PORTR|nr:hypothetical protein [Portunus trituberculatus]